MRKSLTRSALVGLFLVAVAGMFVGQGCSGDESNPSSSTSDPVDNPTDPTDPTDPTPASNVVQIRNFSFSPSTVTISVGETVTWRNNDAVAHTVTSDTGEELMSPLLGQGREYQHTFNAAGTYPYHCTPHPSMTGTVIVQ